jgi:ABC-2 type transport system ATP-binding protein
MAKQIGLTPPIRNVAASTCSDPVIAAHGLVKRFGRVQALDGLDLVVPRGEVHGFLGPNGSGKSTTIRVLLGLLRCGAGAPRVLGLDPWRDAVDLHRRIAYVPGDVTLWPNLSGGEVIDVLTRLSGRPPRVNRAALVERFDVDLARPCRSYSKGNRQKIGLIAALLGDAELFILDEPTSGLDPIMEAVFQQSVHELVAEGRTVLLSSHILSEVDEMCDSVTIIDRGRTVESGRLDELRHLSLVSVDAVTDRPVDLSGVQSVTDLEEDRPAGQVRFRVQSTALQLAMVRLTDAGIRSLTTRPPSLEEMFLRLYADPDLEDRSPQCGP